MMVKAPSGNVTRIFCECIRFKGKNMLSAFSRSTIRTALIGLILVINLQASNILSQWRGPNRDGHYPETGLLESWPKGGPEMLWHADGHGIGYSTAAIAHNRIYLTGMEDGQGYLFCRDMEGKLLWDMHYGTEWKKSYPGARSTPTVVGEQLYLLSGTGILTAVNALTGDLLWSHDLVEEYDGRLVRWGYAESVLIDGDRLYATPGGKKHNIMAFNRHNGEVIWSSAANGEKSAYCSPMIAEHNGHRLLITMMGKSIVALELETGKLIWTYKHKTDWDINPNTPFYKDGKLYCVSGYGTGGVLLELSEDGRSIAEIWRNETLDSQMDGFVVVDGMIFGASHNKPGFHCLDWQTGEELYGGPGIGKGNIITADGMLYFYSDRGDVGLIKPAADAFRLVSSFPITLGEDQHWAHLMIHQGVLYVRHGDILMAFDVKSRS